MCNGVYDHHPEVEAKKKNYLKVLENPWVDSLVWIDV
jgi:hypothetical protein